jgi:hypothetical protein
MKSTLVIVVLLFFASAAQAQRQQRGSASENGQSDLNGYGGGVSEVGGGAVSHGHAVRYEEPRNYSLVYSKNDGPFVPSTFMSYNDALALGQQQVAAAERAARGEGNSLGELARAYRTTKVPTLKLQMRVQQDASGRLEVCNLNGNHCHRPSGF